MQSDNVVGILKVRPTGDVEPRVLVAGDPARAKFIGTLLDVRDERETETETF